MGTKAKWIQALLHFFESSTQETVDVMSPIYFYDDFNYRTFNATDYWNLRDTGAATEALSANAPGGVFALTLDATNEIQLAGIDFNNSRTFPLAAGVNIEFRAILSVPPTGAVVACMGLCGDHNAAVDTVAESIWFRADGNGQITVEHDDTSHETSKVATGITVLNTEWHIYRIDCSDPTDCKFYIDGNRVASGTTFNMNQVPGLVLQPVARIGKEGAATSVGTMLIDYVRVWAKR